MMQANKESLHIVRAFFLGLVLIVVTGCHGGIFGTGDGSTDGPLPENSGDMGGDSTGDTTGGTDSDGSTDGSDTGGSTGGLDGGAEPGTDAGSDGGADGGTGTDGDSSTSPGMQSFENTLSTTTRDDALIVIVNASELNLSVATASGSASPVPLDLITALAFSGHVPLDPALTHNISFFDESLTDLLFQLSPTNLSAGSVSTLVARNAGDVVDLVPLVTQTTTTDSTLARIRLIQTHPLGNTEQTANFTIQSAGDNPGGVEHSFNGISYSNPIGDYIELPAGDYVLSDSLGRLTDQNISFTGSSSVSILINGTGSDALFVFIDSAITLGL